MFTEEIQDRKGNEIHDGDFVHTKVRGGSHEGKVGLPMETPLLPSYNL